MTDTHILFLLSVGICLGAIMMASFYNLFLYVFHKEKLFLYYSLMQFGMVGVLLYDTKILYYYFPSQDDSAPAYKLLSLFTLFFIMMFTREFFETKKRLPHLDKIARYLIWFILLNILFYQSFIIFDFGLYFFVFLFILYIAYRAQIAGFIWAKFFLFGWGVLIATIFLDAFSDFDVKPFYFNPMLVGAVIEALVLALVIAYKFKKLKEEKENEHLLLLQHAKLASLGELLGNIAHQWRQPLSRLGFMLMNIQTSEGKEREAFFKDAQKELAYMSETIDDFKDFYAPSKKKEYFSMAKELHKALGLIEFREIEVEVQILDEGEIYNYKSEFKQVLLNILQNAKDVFEQRAIKHPKITIITERMKLTIYDNGGGIVDIDAESIFEPYMTTKEGSLGIGLYMAKMIIQKHMHGTLQVENVDNGAKFTIELPIRSSKKYFKMK